MSGKLDWDKAARRDRASGRAEDTVRKQVFKPIDWSRRRKKKRRSKKYSGWSRSHDALSCACCGTLLPAPPLPFKVLWVHLPDNANAKPACQECKEKRHLEVAYVERVELEYHPTHNQNPEGSSPG